MEKGKRILFLLYNFLDGGIETVAVSYMNNLAKLTNHEITFAVALDLGEFEVYRERLDKRIKLVHLISNKALTFRKRYTRTHKKSQLVSIPDELFCASIRKHILKKKINKLIEEHDVVIDFDYRHGGYIKPQKDKKVLSFYHFSLGSHLYNKRRKERFIKRTEIFDNIIFISDAMKEEAQNLCPEIKNKFVRLYNPVDTDRIKSMTSETVDESMRQLYAKNYILAVERLSEKQKDISTLIKAFDKLVKEGRNGDVDQLYIIGKGGDRDILEKLIEELGAQNHIKLLGFIANPHPWMERAKAVVHGAKFEGLPTVLIEALMHEKMIVSSDCPTGPREILDNGKVGYLTKVGDVDDTANAMEQAMKDSEQNRQMTEHGKMHKNNFLPENIIANLERLF